jgi:O-antigen/teichoic acid export membrane protein
MRDNLRALWQDRLLRGIVKNSSYIFSSNGAAIVLNMLQGILAARLLGDVAYGVLFATIIPFVSNLHRFVSFRMSEVVVKYLSQFQAEGRTDRAAALVKAAALAETLMTLIAYLLLALAAPLAARYIAGEPGAQPWFLLYGLVLLAQAVSETATGVLQTARRFKQLALVNFIQSIITATLIALAYFTRQGLLAVLLAYLLGKAFTGLAVTALAWGQLGRLLGPRWWRAPLRGLPGWGELARFALSTNLNGTVNLVARDSETLLVSALVGSTAGGYFKMAQGVINLVMLPIEPFIATTYTEISHTIANQQYEQTRRLLKRVTLIAGSWTLATGGFLALLGAWLIPFMYGAEYAPAYPAMLALLVGYGLANALNWNRPLLLALGQPGYPLKVGALAALVKTVLTLWLTPLYGYVAEAGVLSAYFVVTVLANVARGLGEIRRRIVSSEQRAESGGE